MAQRKQPEVGNLPHEEQKAERQYGWILDASAGCGPTNCREQQDASLLFHLSWQTNKEDDKLEIYMGDKNQTIQSYGFVDIPGEIKAPKKGSVPIKISVSEDEGSPHTTFTFKYTVEQIKRPTCRKYGEVEL